MMGLSAVVFTLLISVSSARLHIWFVGDSTVRHLANTIPGLSHAAGSCEFKKLTLSQAGDIQSYHLTDPVISVTFYWAPFLTDLAAGVRAAVQQGASLIILRAGLHDVNAPRNVLRGFRAAGLYGGVEFVPSRGGPSVEAMLAGVREATVKVASTVAALRDSLATESSKHPPPTLVWLTLGGAGFPFCRSPHSVTFETLASVVLSPPPTPTPVPPASVPFSPPAEDIIEYLDDSARLSASEHDLLRTASRAVDILPPSASILMQRFAMQTASVQSALCRIHPLIVRAVDAAVMGAALRYRIPVVDTSAGDVVSLHDFILRQAAAEEEGGAGARSVVEIVSDCGRLAKAQVAQTARAGDGGGHAATVNGGGVITSDLLLWCVRGATAMLTAAVAPLGGTFALNVTAPSAQTRDTVAPPPPRGTAVGVHRDACVHAERVGIPLCGEDSRGGLASTNNSSSSGIERLSVPFNGSLSTLETHDHLHCSRSGCEAQWAVIASLPSLQAAHLSVLTQRLSRGHQFGSYAISSVDSGSSAATATAAGSSTSRYSRSVCYAFQPNPDPLRSAVPDVPAESVGGPAFPAVWSEAVGAGVDAAVAHPTMAAPFGQVDPSASEDAYLTHRLKQMVLAIEVCVAESLRTSARFALASAPVVQARVESFLDTAIALLKKPEVNKKKLRFQTVSPSSSTAPRPDAPLQTSQPAISSALMQTPAVASSTSYPFSNAVGTHVLEPFEGRSSPPTVSADVPQRIPVGVPLSTATVSVAHPSTSAPVARPVGALPMSVGSSEITHRVPTAHVSASGVNDAANVGGGRGSFVPFVSTSTLIWILVGLEFVLVGSCVARRLQKRRAVPSLDEHEDVV